MKCLRVSGSEKGMEESRNRAFRALSEYDVSYTSLRREKNFPDDEDRGDSPDTKRRGIS